MKNTRMLKKNYEFKYVLTKGKYYAGNKIEAVVLQNGKNYNLLGLAIGVKRGKAYARNRVKRLLRENYRKIESEIQPGKSIVFLAKKDVILNDISYSDVEDDMKFIMQKAKIVEN